MNSVLKATSLVALSATLIACGGDDDQNAAVPQNYHDIKTSLQGTVFDAVTGERISTEGLKVTLVQGDKYRKAKINKDFQGDFFVGDIPTSTSTNITYRLDVSYAGYQEFTSLIGFNVPITGLQDKKAAMIGNVYLYPLGVTAPDQTVTVVTLNGERVPNATVLLQPDTSSNTVTTDISSRLVAEAGYQQALQATTDANGIATFSGANLTLGGRYNVDVLPLAYEGKQLAVGATAPITIGTSLITSVVTMNDLLPGTANGLYVVSASNEVSNALQSSGALTITVSQPVEIVNETNTVTAFLLGATTAALDSSAPGSEVTATVSADGLTITLSPNFAKDKAPVVFNDNNLTTADNGLTITYSNLFVRLKGQKDASLYDVFGTFGSALVDGSGGPVSGTVNVTPAF